MGFTSGAGHPSTCPVPLSCGLHFWSWPFWHLPCTPQLWSSLLELAILAPALSPSVVGFTPGASHSGTSLVPLSCGLDEAKVPRPSECSRRVISKKPSFCPSPDNETAPVPSGRFRESPSQIVGTSPYRHLCGAPHPTVTCAGHLTLQTLVRGTSPYSHLCGAPHLTVTCTGHLTLQSLVRGTSPYSHLCGAPLTLQSLVRGTSHPTVTCAGHLTLQSLVRGTSSYSHLCGDTSPYSHLCGAPHPTVAVHVIKLLCTSNVHMSLCPICLTHSLTGVGVKVAVSHCLTHSLVLE